MILSCFTPQDLPEFFEDNMETWMTNFHGLLTLDNKLLQTDVSCASLLLGSFLKLLQVEVVDGSGASVSSGRGGSGSPGAAQVSDL